MPRPHTTGESILSYILIFTHGSLQQAVGRDILEDKISELKGKKLGRVERRVLWYLRGGRLSGRDQESGPLNDLYIRDPGRRYYWGRERFRDSRKWVRTREIARQVYYSQEFRNRSEITRSQKNSTYRALDNLRAYGLVDQVPVKRIIKGRRVNTKKWRITALGIAVVNAYEDELREGKRIRWDEDKLKLWLSED